MTCVHACVQVRLGTSKGVRLRRICEALRPRLLAIPGPDLAQILWSLQRLRYVPSSQRGEGGGGEGFLAEMQGALRARAGELAMSDVIVTILALSRYFKPAPGTIRAGWETQVRGGERGTEGEK